MDTSSVLKLQRPGSFQSMYTARYSSSPEIFQALLDQGAAPLPRCKGWQEGDRPCQEEQDVVGTKAYLDLRNKSLE